MKNKKLVKKLKKIKNEEHRELFMEYIIFCNNAPQELFENYFRIKETDDLEFFSILEFLFKNDCYYMIYRLLEDNRDKMLQLYEEVIEELELKKSFKQRIQRFMITK